MTALLSRFVVALWRELLTTLDSTRPGWSKPAEPKQNAFGEPLSPESLNYWLHAERVRRTLD